RHKPLEDPARRPVICCDCLTSPSPSRLCSWPVTSTWVTPGHCWLPRRHNKYFLPTKSLRDVFLCVKPKNWSPGRCVVLKIPRQRSVVPRKRRLVTPSVSSRPCPITL